MIINDDNVTMNRLANCHNHYQGHWKRVLCVCSAGLLRSPTIAWVLSNEPYNCNTRAAGITKDFALIYADAVLLEWADEIVCSCESTLDVIEGMVSNKPIWCLSVPDHYRTRDPELIRLIHEALDRVGFSGTPPQQ